MSVVRRDVRAFADAAAAVRAAADDVARQVRGAVETGGACVLALAGGSYNFV